MNFLQFRSHRAWRALIKVELFKLLYPHLPSGTEYDIFFEETAVPPAVTVEFDFFGPGVHHTLKTCQPIGNRRQESMRAAMNDLLNQAKQLIVGLHASKE